MSNLQCPVCATELSWWAKLLVGPGLSKRCAGCGAKIYLSRGPAVTLSLVGLFMVYLIMGVFPREEVFLKYSSLLFLFLLVCRVHVLHVPLVTKAKSD